MPAEVSSGDDSKKQEGCPDALDSQIMNFGQNPLLFNTPLWESDQKRKLQKQECFCATSHAFLVDQSIDNPPPAGKFSMLRCTMYCCTGVRCRAISIIAPSRTVILFPQQHQSHRTPRVSNFLVLISNQPIRAFVLISNQPTRAVNNPHPSPHPSPSSQPASLMTQTAPNTQVKNLTSQMKLSSVFLTLTIFHCFCEYRRYGISRATPVPKKHHGHRHTSHLRKETNRKEGLPGLLWKRPLPPALNPQALSDDMSIHEEKLQTDFTGASLDFEGSFQSIPENTVIHSLDFFLQFSHSHFFSVFLHFDVSKNLITSKYILASNYQENLASKKKWPQNYFQNVLEEISKIELPKKLGKSLILKKNHFNIQHIKNYLGLIFFIQGNLQYYTCIYDNFHGGLLKFMFGVSFILIFFLGNFLSHRIYSDQEKIISQLIKICGQMDFTPLFSLWQWHFDSSSLSLILQSSFHVVLISFIIKSHNFRFGYLMPPDRVYQKLISSLMVPKILLVKNKHVLKRFSVILYMYHKFHKYFSYFLIIISIYIHEYACIQPLMLFISILSMLYQCHVGSTVCRQILHLIRTLHCSSVGDRMAWRTCMVTRQPAQHDDIQSHHLVVPTRNEPSLACLTRKNGSQLSIKEAPLHLFLSNIISSSQKINIPSFTSVLGGTPVQFISYYCNPLLEEFIITIHHTYCDTGRPFTNSDQCLV
ncbi:hypothetical protein VP01_285g1 [Puccinia sorghi]|uniref:Uncharacterized protein n=1 Tax=Puccinia sorghi TaxID=27349 RepID=A0A0L6V1Z1_9BASI|nr:hypothetical protein VP01_285g1 [Puccinia sorghi]